MNLTYQPATFTIVHGDQTVALETIFRRLLANDQFETDTLDYQLAQFFIKMRYIPVYIPDREQQYKLVTFLLTDGKAAQLVSPETFHQAIIAYLAGVGYIVQTG